jgi:hypothetical protein
MYTVIYSYRTGYYGQTGRREVKFDNVSRAMEFAARLDSTPGTLDVSVWCGATKIS